MGVTMEALRELHRLHQNLRELRLQIERGPRQLLARQQQLQRKKEELTQAEQELKRLRMLADQKELHLKSGEQKIALLQQRLNEAQSNKEYQALRDQLDADRMAKSVLEDEILDTYTRIDEHRARLEATKQEWQKATEELSHQEQAIGQQGGRLRAQVVEMEALLQQAEAALPGEGRAVYRRLVAARAADAMAAVEHNSCTGCYTAITPQTYNELLMDELVFCKSCGRILYLAE